MRDAWTLYMVCHGAAGLQAIVLYQQWDKNRNVHWRLAPLVK
jgi:hypothetical protein